MTAIGVVPVHVRSLLESQVKKYRTVGFLTKTHLRYECTKANFQPLRTTTQIWTVKHQQYGIFALVPQT